MKIEETDQGVRYTHESGEYVFIGTDCVVLGDSYGELLYWDIQEWTDEPELLLTITREVCYAMSGGLWDSLSSELKVYLVMMRENGHHV